LVRRCAAARDRRGGEACDIYTTGALASIFTLIFVSVLGFIKIARMEKAY